MSEEEVLFSEQVLQVPFNYSAGPVASRFLIGLRDEKKILGLRCSGCGKVYVPPRGLCPGCFTAMDDWVEVGPEGVLDNFTVVHYSESTHPEAAPFALGLIRLDGADTCLLHLVRIPDGGDLAAGTRVAPVFAVERRGHILDVVGFEACPE